MVRNAVADENFSSYITNLAIADTCTVGLILGQPTTWKDYIIHFARTPNSNGDGEKDVTTTPKKFSDISEVWLADHARHATRMLPGGMYVLGIFIVCSEDIFTPLLPKLKAVMSQIHRRLNSNEFLYGNPETSEKLILHYNIRTHQYTCRSFDFESSNIKPADIKFQSKLAVKWLQIECNYELDQVFQIAEERTNWPLKKHMQEILKSINDDFKSSVFMYDGEIRDGEDCLELIGKKKKVPRAKSGHYDSGHINPMQVTIILPCDAKSIKNLLEIHNSGGQIRLTGHVACKLWLHPKATVTEASQAVVQDLVRSLAARLEMHWDSLIEEEHGSPEDTNSIHEPPRRVLVGLPTSSIKLSDYLFPGEGPQEAQISLQELLDIKISDNNAIKDIEGQADLTEMYKNDLEADSEEILHKLPKAANKQIYLVGLGIAFVVLILSLLIHFLKDSIF